ncbi:hypothetical protein JL720_14936 [Aureococcus anophagefferens]|nr:hypothetical protein JL720_14936 [Aureococcus anophagefferens]
MLRARVVAFAATVAVAQYANLEKYAAFDTTHGVASSEGLSLRLGASSAVGGALLHGDEAWERRLEFGAPSVVYDTDRYKLWYGACVAGRCGSGDATRALLYAESADGVRWRKPRLGLVHWPVGGASAANNLVVMGAGGAGVFEDANPREPSSRRFKAVAAAAPGRAAARRARVARRPRLGAAPPRHGRRVAGRPGERLLGAALGRYVSAYLGFAAARGRCEPYWSPDTERWFPPSTRSGRRDVVPPGNGVVCGRPVVAGGRTTVYYLEGAGNATLRAAAYGSDAFAGLGAGKRAGTLRSRALPCRGEPPAVTVAVGGAGSVKAALLDVRGDALAGYSMAESSPILADAADATLAWSATATRVPELPEACSCSSSPTRRSSPLFRGRRRRQRDAAERHRRRLVGEAELLGIARLFGLLGATTLACAGLRGACARVATVSTATAARGGPGPREPRDELTPALVFFPRGVRQGVRGGPTGGRTQPDAAGRRAATRRGLSGLSGARGAARREACRGAGCAPAPRRIA